MCYYNGVKVTLSEYIRLKQIEKQLRGLQLKTKINKGFDYSDWPIIKPIPGTENDISIELAQWGFLPDMVHNQRGIETFRSQRTTLNAQSENLFISEQGGRSMWKEAARKGRCLVLSSGFVEYRHLFLKNKRTGEVRKTATTFPYWISLPNREYFYMAGIYNHWIDQGENFEKDTFAIITAPANSLMEQIHNTKKRMPTILTDDLAYSWLFDDLTDKQIQKIAGHQYPAEQMIAHPISREFMTIENPEAYFEYKELKEVPLAV